jgi:hypothetical protein
MSPGMLNLGGYEASDKNAEDATPYPATYGRPARTPHGAHVDTLAPPTSPRAQGVTYRIAPLPETPTDLLINKHLGCRRPTSERARQH